MRVVIGEDSVLLREGLRSLLEDAAIEVVAVAADAVELLEAVAATRPDLVLVDVRMPPTFTDEGLRAALEIRASQPAVAIVVLSQYVEETYALELIGGGSERIGYLLKDRVADVGEFLDTLRLVAAGGAAIDPEVVSQLVRRRRSKSTLDRLTARELDVLALMAEGRSNSAISGELQVSVGAVEKHINSLFQKLDLLPALDDHRRVLAVLTFLGQ
ncbi:MAG: response regulator transcription factor [Acidimicrobiia bacterium]|nr:response regulator transcription factor [Acidimicrobiia bacterium]